MNKSPYDKYCDNKIALQITIRFPKNTEQIEYILLNSHIDKFSDIYTLHFAKGKQINNQKSNLNNNPIITLNRSFQMIFKTQQDYDQLKDIHNQLLQSVTVNRGKNQSQKLIYRQIIKAFHVFSKQLQGIATRINDQILKSQLTDQYQNTTYQYLSNSLLRFGQCSRKVASKCKNQVLDPFSLFAHNYYQLNSKQLRKVQQRIGNLRLHMQQLQTQRQNYRMANVKLQRQKEQQTKMMLKMQTNTNSNQQSQNQLTRYMIQFNLSIKKLIQNISLSQKFYLGAVEKMNYQWLMAKQDLQKAFVSLNYNQQSRNSFCRKSAIYCIKSLEEFQNAIDSEVQKKIQDSSKNLSAQHVDSDLQVIYFGYGDQKKLKLRINSLIGGKIEEEYQSYEDQLKQSRKQSMEAEEAHLVEIFQKVKQADKQVLKRFIKPWFSNTNGTTIKSNSNNNSDKQKQRQKPPTQQPQPTLSSPQLQSCKQKLLTQIPYTYYFIQLIYFKIVEMNSIYCKLQDQAFNYLNNTFNAMLNILDIEKNNVQLNVEFVYKIIHISQRVMKKRSPVESAKSLPIELICHHIARGTNKFKSQTVLKRIYNFIQKKKQDKKKQGKGVMSSLTKGLFTMVTGKRDPILNQDQQFSCMQQFCNIMSNLSVPTEISLPFIKQILGSQNQVSFQYLKSIILTKKDVAERQKIFYKREIKERMEKEMGDVVRNKRMGEYCIMLTAKHGYLGLQSIRLRQTSRSLSLIHQQILHRMKLPTTVKWPHMIPVNHSMQYLDLIQTITKYKNPQIDQIISLDVNRSLHMHIDYLKPEILTEILKLYAYSHKEISYCQGMNYIAGYLFIKTKQAENCYRLFQYLMEQRFKQLFANQFQVLKIKMYQFQRLLAIYHPEISQHFKRQSILPQCYIISWIITLFASSYQYTMESYLIDLLWERFIIGGWREFFRFVLWLFSLYKEEIIEMTYDKALHFFGDLVKSPLFLSDRKKFLQEQKHIGNPDEAIQSYHVSDELLENLRKEYYLM